MGLDDDDDDDYPIALFLPNHSNTLSDIHQVSHKIRSVRAEEALLPARYTAQKTHPCLSYNPIKHHFRHSCTKYSLT